ncbi:MAG TPA: hypothetical protein VGH19_09950 [Verrucomicrobiae bacterium]
MSDAFVPFQPKQASSSVEPKTSFQQLKPELTAAPVSMVAEPKMIPAPAGQVALMQQHQHNSPQVTLQREGDRVTGIRVECGCGQVVMLNCVY